MTSVTILNDRVKSKNEVIELSQGWNLPRHMAEHIYMFSGESIAVKFITTEDLMDNLIDWFGKGLHIETKTDSQIMVTVRCNRAAMKYWALQFGEYIEIMEPLNLRDEIKVVAEKMVKKYSINKNINQ